MVQVISYQRCRSPAGTVWVSCDVRRDLDWALSCAGTADSFEFHCGNFHVAQLLLRAWHGKRRRFPCTAADFHSCVGGSYTLQRRKDLGPGRLAIQKTVAVIIQSSTWTAKRPGRPGPAVFHQHRAVDNGVTNSSGVLDLTRRPSGRSLRSSKFSATRS